MLNRIANKLTVLCAVTGIAALALAGTASASPSPSLSFGASSDGASAGWSSGKGSPIELTLGSSQGSFAEIELHHVQGSAVAGLQEPVFATNNYAAGSPRFFITLSDGKTLWGYPPQSGVNGSAFGWAIDNGNTYQSWTAIQSAEGAATVTGSFVIADADQSAGTVDTITGLNFAGNHFN